MKKIIILIAVLLCALCVAAQSEPVDSLPAQELREIVIEAPKVIRKADMDIYHPSKSAVEASKNGLQLLGNLMIPTLTVSDALGSIQAAGQSVQLRINGRESSIEQVRALLPETIRRVEWIDNPGLRYGGANYVLNFIVSNPTVGGSLMAMARPALNQAWGFYMADAKFNTGHSQWEIGANLKLTDNIKTHRDYTETFTYPDGSSLTRDETSKGGDLHKAEDVERVMMDMLAAFKTRLMNIPSKVAPALENRDAAYIKDRLTKEVLEVLNELKDYNPKDFYSDEYVEGEEDAD